MPQTLKVALQSSWDLGQLPKDRCQPSIVFQTRLERLRDGGDLHVKLEVSSRVVRKTTSAVLRDVYVYSLLEQNKGA